MDKLWNNHTMEYYTAMRMTDLQLHRTIWMKSHEHNVELQEPETKIIHPI